MLPLQHFKVTAHGLCFSLAGTRHHVHYLFSSLYGLIKQGAKSCSLLLFTSCFEFFFFLPFLFSFTPFPLLLMSLHHTCSLFSSCSLCSLHLCLSPFPSPPSTCERLASCSGREVPFLLRLNWHAHSRLLLARKGVNGTEAAKSLLHVIKRWWEVIPSEEPASCCHTQAHIPDLPLVCTLPP